MITILWQRRRARDPWEVDCSSWGDEAELSGCRRRVFAEFLTSVADYSLLVRDVAGDGRFRPIPTRRSPTQLAERAALPTVSA